MRIRDIFYGVVLVVIGAVAGVALYVRSSTPEYGLVNAVAVPVVKDVGLKVHCPALAVVDGTSRVYEDGSVTLQSTANPIKFSNCIVDRTPEF